MKEFFEKNKIFLAIVVGAVIRLEFSALMQTKGVIPAMIRQKIG